MDPRYIAKMKYLYVLLVLVFSASESVAAETLISLPKGIINGSETTTPSGKVFYAFEGIPYAAPPIGDLRFQPPVPPEAWEGVLDTTSLNKICYQSSADFEQETEDCLYINVYTPQLPDETESELLPVIFYVYGGGFTGGNGLHDLHGPEFFIEYDVIIVTFNYRLGPFGFLSTQDLVLPGNAGLKDQLLALKWTNENIKLFGGDPAKVTISGQSAGAASVSYLMLNEETEGLFRAAICESGSSLSPFAYQRNAKQYAFQTAQFIDPDFKSDNSTELLYFLLEQTAEDLDEASSQMLQQENDRNLGILKGAFYAPVLEPEHETAFITKKMYGSISRGEFQQVPLMIGVTSEEEIHFGRDKEGLTRLLALFEIERELMVPDDMNIEDDTFRKQVGGTIRLLYSPNAPLEENLGAGIKFFSDSGFTRSVLKHAYLQSKYTDVFLYQFSYDGEMGNIDIHIDGAERVAHAEENNYIWRRNWTAENFDNHDLSKFPDEDLTTQKRLLKLFTDFAKTLNPTPEPSELLENVTWPTVSSEGKNYYLDIGANLVVKKDLKVQTFPSWDFIYGVAGFGEFDTF